MVLWQHFELSSFRGGWHKLIGIHPDSSVKFEKLVGGDASASSLLDATVSVIKFEAQIGKGKGASFHSPASWPERPCCFGECRLDMNLDMTRPDDAHAYRSTYTNQIALKPGS